MLNNSTTFKIYTDIRLKQIKTQSRLHAEIHVNSQAEANVKFTEVTTIFHNEKLNKDYKSKLWRP